MYKMCLSFLHSYAKLYFTKIRRNNMPYLFSLLSAVGDNPGGAIPQEIRNNVQLAFMILMTLAAVAIIVIVLMQKGTNDNVGAISGSSDTYYGKNKGKTTEQRLKIATFALFTFILVCAIIVSVVMFVGTNN